MAGKQGLWNNDDRGVAAAECGTVCDNVCSRHPSAARAASKSHHYASFSFFALDKLLFFFI